MILIFPKKYIFFLLMLFVPLCFYGQNHTSILSRFRIGWVSEPTSYDKNPNAIIKEISDDVIKNLKNTEIFLDIPVHYNVTAGTEDQDTVVVEIESPFITGDKVIRGFDLSGVLRPDKIFLSFCQKRKSDSLIIRKQEWKNLDWKKGDTSFSFIIKDYDKPNDTMIFAVTRCAFSEEALDAFMEKVRIVNDYYACSAVLDSLLPVAMKVKIGDINNLPLNFVWVEEFSKIIRKIGDKNFEEKLDLERFDPQNFRGKYRELFRLSKSTEMTFRQKLDSAILIEPPYSLDIPVQKYVDGVMKYIRWSLLVNSRNGRIYEDYLNAYFTTHVFGDDLLVLKELMLKIYPAENADTSFRRLCKLVCRKYESVADSLIAGSSHAEASKLLENEEHFIRYSGMSAGDHGYETLKTNASNGIYDSYLSVAESSIKCGRYEMAENYLSKAQEYRINKAPFITSDSLLRVVSKRLLGLKLTTCDTLAAHGNYDEAIACYNNVAIVFDSLTDIILKEEILKKTAFCMFHKLRNSGLTYLAKNNPAEAGKLFMKAENIRIKNNFPADTILDSLCKAEFPWYLVSLLRESEELIWDDQLERAAKIADSVFFLATNAGINDHNGLTLQLAHFRKKIRDKGCYDASERFDILVLRGQRNLELRNYIKAVLLLDSALMIPQNTDCQLVSQWLQDTVSKYRDPAFFQKQFNMTNNLISINEYKAALANYLSLEQFHREKELSRYGLTFQSLYDFVKSRSVTGLTLESVNYYLSGEKYSDAFQFLVLLKLQDFPVKSSEKIQAELGEKLALSDFQKRKSDNPEEFLTNYSSSDKWFSKLRTSYLSQWNELKRDSSRH